MCARIVSIAAASEMNDSYPGRVVALSGNGSQMAMVSVRYLPIS